MSGSQSSFLPRLVAKLRHALGQRLCSALDDPDVVEIMGNADGKLFVERLGGRIETAGELPREAAETIIGSVAHVLKSEVDDRHPIVSGELPLGGHRFEGLLPPIVAGPCFTIRRRASRLIQLGAYVDERVMTAGEAAIIGQAVALRQNIVIAGGTGSGKTTLSNAILAEIASQSPHERLVILEDTVEIRCTANNQLSLRTSDTVDMSRLLKSTMRLRPDRIIVGEVRDGAALTLLKAWNTGHPGGLATLHANGARQALQRLEQLIAEASLQQMENVIGEAVDLIIAIARTPQGRKVTELVRVTGYAAGRYLTQAARLEERHAA